MAKLYYKQIKADLMNIDEVPPLWRKSVQAMLDLDEGK